MCGRNSAREGQLLLQDVEFPERDSEKHAVVCTACGEGDELAEVFLRRCAEETKLIGSRKTRGEQETEGACSGGSRLATYVFLGTKIAASELSGECPRKGFQDGIAEDRTEKGGSECPASLQTEINADCNSVRIRKTMG